MASSSPSPKAVPWIGYNDRFGAVLDGFQQSMQVGSAWSTAVRLLFQLLTTMHGRTYHSLIAGAPPKTLQFAREANGSVDAPSYPTILHALEDVARRTPDRQALICEDRSLTFAQHKSAISGFAKRLQKIGVEGERVAILMTNCLEMPVCILGAMAAHAYVAPMNPNYSDSELTPLLKDTTPKVIVTAPEFYARLSKVAGAMGTPFSSTSLRCAAFLLPKCPRGWQLCCLGKLT